MYKDTMMKPTVLYVELKISAVAFHLSAPLMYLFPAIHSAYAEGTGQLG